MAASWWSKLNRKGLAILQITSHIASIPLFPPSLLFLMQPYSGHKSKFAFWLTFGSKQWQQFAGVLGTNWLWFMWLACRIAKWTFICFTTSMPRHCLCRRRPRLEVAFPQFWSIRRIPMGLFHWFCFISPEIPDKLHSLITKTTNLYSDWGVGVLFVLFVGRNPFCFQRF